MSSVPMPEPQAGLRGQAFAWWRSLAPRERRNVRWAAVAVAALIVWLLAIQPALRTLNEAPPQIDRLDAELQQMKLLAAESRALRATPPVTLAQASLGLKAATERLGSSARLLMQGDRATLNLSGVNGDALRAWLFEARAAARARPIEAQLSRGPLGYTGTLTVALGGTP